MQYDATVGLINYKISFLSVNMFMCLVPVVVSSEMDVYSRGIHVLLVLLAITRNKSTID